MTQELETEIQAEAPVQETVVENIQPDKSESAPRSEKPVKESVRDTILRSTKEIESRSRDESGKFVKEAKPKAPKEPDIKDTKAAPQEKPVEAAPKESQPVVETPQASDAPKAWGKEKQVLWNSLPQEAKDFLIKREEQVSSGFAQYQNLGPVKQVLDGHNQYFQQTGISPADYLRNAIQWEQAFRNPATRETAIRQFAQSYGVDLSTAPQPADPNNPAQTVAPIVQQYVSPLQQEVSALKATLSQQEQERINSTLQNFAKDHPHFEKVRIRMGQLIQSGAVQPNDLESAYQQATWADPEIRNEMMKAEFEKQTKAAQDAAERAKKANVSVTTRAPVAPMSNGHDKSGPQTVRDSIMSAIREGRENMRA